MTWVPARIMSVAVLVALSLYSGACSKKAPECGNAEVSQLVSSITSDSTFTGLSQSATTKVSQAVTFTVSDALAGGLSQDGAKRTCEATLVAAFSTQTKESLDPVLTTDPGTMLPLFKLMAASVLRNLSSKLGGAQGAADEHFLDRANISKKTASVINEMNANNLAEIQQAWNPKTRQLAIPVKYSVSLLEDDGYQVTVEDSEQNVMLKFVSLLAAEVILSDAKSPKQTASPSSPESSDLPKEADTSEETVIVREYALQRDYSARIIVDRLDYNQKNMEFTLTAEDEKLHDFVKQHLNVAIVVKYEMEPELFFVVGARKK